MKVKSTALTVEEWSVLCKIARKTKMDCWFCLMENKQGECYVFDLEANEEMDIDEGVQQLAEGIVSYKDCSLYDREITVFENLLGKLGIEPENTRVCSECGKKMTRGFVLFDGVEYYCSEKCLYENYTMEQYEELYECDDGYWTEWEDE